MLVGIVPLAALVGGFVGYQLASGDGESGGGGESTTSDEPPEGTATGPEADELVVATTVTTELPAPAAPQRPLLAEGTVTDDVIELAGRLPAEPRTRWLVEVQDLADSTGRSLVDRTEAVVAETGAGAGGAAPGPAELLVRFRGAVVFLEGSARGFERNNDALFGAVAGVLNRGTAQLTIVGYAEPGDPDAEALATGRADHVREHLLELGVDPARVTVETRDPDQLVVDTAPSSPVDRRTDLEFLFLG